MIVQIDNQQAKSGMVHLLQLAPVLFIFSSIMIFTYPFVMEPIKCNAIDFKDFIEPYCLLEGNVPISANMRTFPRTREEREAYEKKKIMNYNLVSLILFFQCLLFCLPHIMWKQFSVDHHNLIKMIQSRDKMQFNMVEKKIMQHFFPRHGTPGAAGWKWLCCYVAVKFLHITICIVQLIFMWHFFNMSLSPTELLQIEAFPYITQCHVPGNPSVGMRDTKVQCVLYINILCKMVYLAFWMFLLIDAIVQAIYIPFWLIVPSLFKKGVCVLSRSCCLRVKSIRR